MLNLEAVSVPKVSVPPMPTEETKIAKAVRTDIRRVREAAGVTQDEAAKLLNYANRGVISKIENGHFQMQLIDYLTLVNYCGHAVPDHPALALLRHLVPARPPR